MDFQTIYTLDGLHNTNENLPRGKEAGGKKYWAQMKRNALKKKGERETAQIRDTLNFNKMLGPKHSKGLLSVGLIRVRAQPFSCCHANECFALFFVDFFNGNF